MRILFAIMCIFCIASAASAEKVGEVNGADWTPRGSCDITDYKPFTGSGGPIPDNDPAGILIGPIATGPPAGPGMLDVAVELHMTHTWVGDLIVDVIYDGDCDGLGGADDTVVGIMCRPARDCDPAAGGFGCSGDLAGPYLFSDAGDPTWEAACPAVIAPACLAPDADSSAGSALADFDGLLKGGCFYVFASDNAGGDTGAIDAVIIWTLNDPGTPTETVSWSGVKSRF